MLYFFSVINVNLVKHLKTYFAIELKTIFFNFNEIFEKKIILSNHLINEFVFQNLVIYWKLILKNKN